MNLETLSPSVTAALALLLEGDLCRYVDGYYALPSDARRVPGFWLVKPMPIRAVRHVTLEALSRAGFVEAERDTKGPARIGYHLTQEGREFAIARLT